MKIHERVSNYLELLHQDEAISARPAAQETATRETVETSAVAVDISAAATQLADDEARRERLNAIRQQLSEGSYNISGKDVADKILNVLKG